MTLQTTPTPWYPGLQVAWWVPFLLTVAVVMILPLFLVSRVRPACRLLAMRWFGTVPIAGLAILSWAAAYRFLTDLGSEQSCRSVGGNLLCPVANPLLIIGAFGWASIATGLAALLFAELHWRNPPRARRFPKRALLLMTAGNLAMGAIDIPLAKYQVLPLTVDLTIQITFVTLGLIVFGIACVEFASLLNASGKVAGWLAFVNGSISLTLALVLAVGITFPPGLTSRDLPRCPGLGSAFGDIGAL